MDKKADPFEYPKQRYIIKQINYIDDKYAYIGRYIIRNIIYLCIKNIYIIYLLCIVQYIDSLIDRNIGRRGIEPKTGLNPFLKSVLYA